MEQLQEVSRQRPVRLSLGKRLLFIAAMLSFGGVASSVIPLQSVQASSATVINAQATKPHYDSRHNNNRNRHNNNMNRHNNNMNRHSNNYHSAPGNR